MPAIDPDFIRSLLLSIENGRHAFQIVAAGLNWSGAVDRSSPAPSPSADRLAHHLGALEENGLVQFRRPDAGRWLVECIAAAGHAFLDAIRDDKAWASLKAAAADLGTADLPEILKSAGCNPGR